MLLSSRTTRFLAVWATLLLCVVAGVPHALAAERFDTGHVDAFYVTAPGGDLTLGLKEDITGNDVEHPGDDVVLVVKESAWNSVTEGIPDIGGSSYFLPQDQDHSLLWPGWDTQPAGRAGFDNVDLVFEDVSGPGSVYVFRTSNFGDVEPVTGSGSIELTRGETINQPYGAHRHANWAFSKPGTYEMTVHAESKGKTSNSVTYTWEVGDSSGSDRDVDRDHGNDAKDDDKDNTDKSTSHGSLNRTQTSTSAQPSRAAAPRSTQARAAAPRPAAPRPAESAPAPEAASESAVCVAGLNPKIKDDTVSPPAWIDADGATFYISDSGKVDLPQDIGPVPQGPAWMIGSTQVAGVPWLGANTQHPTMREYTSGPVTWDITSFNGPGDVMVYTQGGLGTIVGNEWFRIVGGQAQGAVDIPENTHVHPNWLFSQPGDYSLTIRQTATTTDGETVSGEATLHFAVGGGQPGGALSSGHFDFGAEVNPDGGDCSTAPGSIGVAPTGGTTSAGDSHSASGRSADVAGDDAAVHQAGAESGALRPGTKLAATSESYLAWGVGALGVGMLVLGLGVGLLAWTRYRA